MKAGLMESPTCSSSIRRTGLAPTDSSARSRSCCVTEGRFTHRVPAHHGVDLRRSRREAGKSRRRRGAAGGRGAERRRGPAAGRKAAPAGERCGCDGASSALWTIPVLKTVAEQGTGVDELVAALERHRDWMVASGRCRRSGASGWTGASACSGSPAARTAWEERGGRRFCRNLSKRSNRGAKAHTRWRRESCAPSRGRGPCTGCVQHDRVESMGVMDREAAAAGLEDRLREKDREIAELRARLAEWEAAFRRTPTRETSFTTVSGVPVAPLYTPLDAPSVDEYLEKIGFPGEYPFTRGPYTTMYRTRLWTMRQFAGFGTAEETNRRYHYLLDHGQTGSASPSTSPRSWGTTRTILALWARWGSAASRSRASPTWRPSSRGSPSTRSPSP